MSATPGEPVPPTCGETQVFTGEHSRLDENPPAFIDFTLESMNVDQENDVEAENGGIQENGETTDFILDNAYSTMEKVVIDEDKFPAEGSPYYQDVIKIAELAHKSAKLIMEHRLYFKHKGLNHTKEFALSIEGMCNLIENNFSKPVDDIVIKCIHDFKKSVDYHQLRLAINEAVTVGDKLESAKKHNPKQILKINDNEYLESFKFQDDTDEEEESIKPKVKRIRSENMSEVSPPVFVNNVNFNPREGCSKTVDTAANEIENNNSENMEIPSEQDLAFRGPRDCFYIAVDENYCRHMAEIFKLSKGTVECKLTGENIKVTCTDGDQMRIVQRYLENSDAKFEFIPNKRKERIYKALLRGLPPITSPTQILNSLLNQGFNMDSVVNLKRYRDKLPLPLFLLKIKQSENMNDIFRLKRLPEFFLNLSIIPFQGRVTQCYRCQRWGHGSSACKHFSRCLKCGESHDTRTCLKPKDTPAKCCNCQGAHTANYSLCPENPNNPQYTKNVPRHEQLMNQVNRAVNQAGLPPP